MRMQEFFEHHGLASNPFADEDAQSDPIFKQVMSTAVFHPSWDKIYGRPEEASTAIVFGEKGSGKTALRLQIHEHVERHNRENPDARGFIIQYDDFNQFNPKPSIAGEPGIPGQRMPFDFGSVLDGPPDESSDDRPVFGPRLKDFDLGGAGETTPPKEPDTFGPDEARHA